MITTLSALAVVCLLSLAFILIIPHFAATKVLMRFLPRGIFMICNESDGTDATGLKFEKIIDGMKNYTVEQIETALKTAGFSGVSSDHHPSRPWITVIAGK